MRASSHELYCCSRAYVYSRLPRMVAASAAVAAAGSSLEPAAAAAAEEDVGGAATMSSLLRCLALIASTARAVSRRARIWARVVWGCVGQD